MATNVNSQLSLIGAAPSFAADQSAMLASITGTRIVFDVKDFGVAEVTIVVPSDAITNSFAFALSENTTTGFDGDYISVPGVDVTGFQSTSIPVAAGTLQTLSVQVGGYAKLIVEMQSSGGGSDVAVTVRQSRNPIPLFIGANVTNSLIPVPISGTVSFGATPQVNVAPAITIGASLHHQKVSQASNNATSVKASQGVVNAIHLTNNSLSWRYFKFYNKGSAPSPASDTPVQTIGLPPESSFSVDCGMAGRRFTTGIAYAIVAGVATNDNVAIGANEVVVNLNYT